LEDLGIKTNNHKAKILAKTLDQATAKFLDNDKSPSRTSGELDNRGSHFYLAMYWAQALAEQNEDAELKSRFIKLAETLTENEVNIISDLNISQGHHIDLGGYYRPEIEKVTKVMRPSEIFNTAIDSLLINCAH
tara:strand:- start:5016 stop:5417 length:402 start_codon:yes stop_codon:yes gene_type:complete